jgi:two-component system response regulator YesN
MGYKVFLVEDEIVTREGIRDNVNWKSADFEFCGEAPDGEMALPLIEESKPDILITDIKMPFMDGLQLSKIVREQMPWIKIIILSGHDEFEYAQAAVKLGVTEYLLKPISSDDLLKALKRIEVQLDKERKEHESYAELQEQSQGNLDLLREKFLLRLVMGGISSVEAIEQSKQFGLNLIAQSYLVLLFKIELCDKDKPFDYYEYQRVEKAVADRVSNNPNVLYIKKDLEELVLLLIGYDPDQLQKDGSMLSNSIKKEVEKENICNLTIGMGTPQQRLGDIHRSFVEALVHIRNTEAPSHAIDHDKSAKHVELSQLDRNALENYLKFGVLQDYDDFYTTHLQPLGEASLRSDLIKNYLLVDVVLTVTQSVESLGGQAEQIIPETNDIESLLKKMVDADTLYEVLKNIIVSAITFRNSRIDTERSKLIQEAKFYIDEHYHDPELKMHLVAERYNISSGHFSTVFSQEVGESFRDYVTKLRINRAKELLRSTNLKSSEIAPQVGYNDPHYFSTVFKNNTGLSPLQFRAQTQGNIK